MSGSSRAYRASGTDSDVQPATVNQFPVSSAAYDEACERAGASLRPPMTHGSRKVNYHVRGINSDLDKILDRLDTLVAEVDEPLTQAEVRFLRQHVRAALAQIVYVLDANEAWSRKGALDAFNA